MLEMFDGKKPGQKVPYAIGKPSALKTAAKGEIRPLSYSDIKGVAKLSRKTFSVSGDLSIDYLTQTIEKLYDQERYNVPAILPLVSRNAHGLIDGFLGVATTTFLYNEEKILVANCYHLMADKKARARLVPLKLLQKFMSGPQDFSFADGSIDVTRKLWDRMGGEAVVGESIYYKVPLRPTSFLLRPVLKKVATPLQNILHLSGRATDAAAGTLRVPIFHRSKPSLTLVPLHPKLLLQGLDSVRSRYSVFPRYDQLKIEQKFTLLEDEKRNGLLHKIAIMDDEKNILGWFIYYSKKGDVCEVIQAVAIPGREEDLFNTLTWHAYTMGGVELSGRLMPSQVGSSFSTKAFCMPGRMWTLIHSSRDDLKCEMQSGRVFLTRFEGDLWLI